MSCFKIITSMFENINILSQLMKMKCFIFPKTKPGDKVPELSV